MAKKITFKNFFTATVANFTKVTKKELPNREPDFTSKSGSQYWYEDDKVYRKSTHFMRSVASCKWFLERYGSKRTSGIGVCKLSDFIPRIFDKDLEVGKKYRVLFAPKDRTGTEYLSEFTDVFVKLTKEYIVFEKQRVGVFSFCTAIKVKK